MANEDVVVPEEEDVIEELPEVEEGQEDQTDWKALALKNQGIAKRMKTKLEKSKEVKPEVIPPVVEKPKVVVPPAEDITNVVRQQLEERDLEALEVSDELKKEVQTYAKLQGISIKKAMNSDYIQFRKEKEELKLKTENASLTSKRKGTAKKDYSETQATDFDLTTPEGKAGFKEYKEWLKTQ